MSRLHLMCIPIFLFLEILHCQRDCSEWSGEKWGAITRDEIDMIADEMIDSYWSPAKDIYNFCSGNRYTLFRAGVTYRGEAYMMSNPVHDWDDFICHVNQPSSDTTYYGNDCSAFVSICWKMTRRHTTSTIEGDSHVILLGRIGECDDVDLIVGDACNSKGNHIILFDYYADAGGVMTMEQTPTTAYRKYRSWSSLRDYRPLRRQDLKANSIPTFAMTCFSDAEPVK